MTPTKEEIEKAAKEYARTVQGGTDLERIPTRIAFECGAEWALQQVAPTIAHQDAIIGRLTRENQHLIDAQRRRNEWLSKAKSDAGFADSVSFDVVWKCALDSMLNKPPTIEHLTEKLDDEK